jgi:hypothetical protein
MLDRYVGADVHKLVDIVRARMTKEGRAMGPRRGGLQVIAKYLPDRREAARAELARRGFSDEELETIRHGAPPRPRHVVAAFLARGGSRYGR